MFEGKMDLFSHLARCYACFSGMTEDPVLTVFEKRKFIYYHTATEVVLI